MLKGEAKKTYQRNYMRDYMRQLRSNNVKTPLRPVKTPLLRPKLDNLRQLIKGIETRPQEKPAIPLYNPTIHRAGDTVLIQRGKRLIQTTIPQLDADGNPMPDCR